ncbi:hypothetical protein FHW36_10555 [Chitinophaga polysaccharea]|uniref:Nucleotidyltransferase n=1 Tax=Chitinophaga polysaccharea TaxID=1293035 RepID=A0A561PNF9_9BACT|nr:hypothetical protein [Chitinophaga polysaccharea]TWF39618.1 hypothetical protein FHW36_10555 [Chitinophaga polysaccharea]
MAVLNYTKRLSNLKDRRFDKELNELFASRSFSSNEIPDNLKYLLESMRPIDKKYNDRTVLAADRVMNHLEANLKLHFSRAYKRQGSVQTNTNIKVHSDVDLLTVIDKYHYIDPRLPNLNPYTASDPSSDIKDLRSMSYHTLNGIYDYVDNSNEKCISIFNKSLNRKVDVVFCFWYNSEEYQRTSNEHYRGIKFKASSIVADYPFAHLNNVNYKGDVTRDGARRGIRLLKTLKADSEPELNLLKGFQLTSIVYSMQDSLLYYTPGKDLDIAKAISSHVGYVIDNPLYRKGVKSPNGLEYPLSSDDIVPELRLLKSDLDTLTEDVQKELSTSWRVSGMLNSY